MNVTMYHCEKGCHMKALILEEYNQFAVRDLPVPEPDTGEVLVRVKACGICGSDVHGLDGSTGRRIPPLVMGHEASGTIERLGRRCERVCTRRPL